MNVNDLYNFNKKTVLITGASSGFGKQFAITLNDAGARVILAARSLDKLQSLAKTLDNSIVVEMDVADYESVALAFAELEKIGERIDVCINSAGIRMLTPVFNEVESDSFAKQIQTNLMGSWYVSKLVANHMKKYNIHGSIINIGSISGSDADRPDAAGYATSKAAVIHMTKALAEDLARYKIRINCINPGLHHTPMTAAKLDDPEMRKKLEEKIPLKFVGEPIDLSAAMLYLASNKASRFVTGSVITVDGGMSNSYQ